MSEGCKYCYMEDGDIPHDRKNLFDFNIGRMCNVNICAYSMICDNELAISVGAYNGISGSKDKIVKINFCPMCGRKL